MKILIIGSAGTIGKRVSNHLKSKGHKIIGAGRTSSPSIDIASVESMESFFSKNDNFDAAICIAGQAKWAEMDLMTEEDYYIGIRSKLMGQVNLARIARKYLTPKGSITLSTGILADKPVPLTTSAAMVNGAIHSFVLAAQTENKGDYRLNAVALGLVEDSYETYKLFFSGHIPISMKSAVEAYERVISGNMSGEIIKVYE